MSDSGGKALFKTDEGGTTEFYVQYNPKELKFGRSVSWKKKENIGSDGVPLEYEKGDPNVLNMELFFDTTHESSTVDVRTTWVNGLLQFTQADYTPSGTQSTTRPKVLEFIWSGFRYKGVIEKIDVQYLMFASDGTPVRAKVSVAMKEWKDDYSWGGGGASAHQLPDLALIATKAGDTAASVAQENNADIRQICEENGISDPTAELPQGTELAIDRNTGNYI